jgi:Uma2 family endonuclease
MSDRRSLTYAQYLAAEARSDHKHWFFEEEAHTMPGRTPEHAALAAAVIAELENAVRARPHGRPYRVFTSRVRVRVAETGMATYPDVTVVRGKVETDPEDPSAITNPVLLVEVLSDATEAHDRGEKAAHYRKIPTLREYVLVATKTPRIEIYRKNEAQRWELFDVGVGERAELLSVRCSLDVSAIYGDPRGVS